MRKIILITGALTLAAALAAGALVFFRPARLQQKVLNALVKNIVPMKQDTRPNFDIARLLSRERPYTFLFLFLNNTELRPGGGFIGAYAVAQIDKFQPRIIKVEGTEILDNNAPKENLPAPPRPLGEYLRVRKWYFRDGNWSPDFAAAASTTLALYRAEGGLEAANIDAVVGFTPTVIEEMLKISGPLAVNGQAYDYSNITERLEYEVEYGYAAKGLRFSERKKELADLTRVFADKMTLNIPLHLKEYLELFEKMFRAKQAAVYFLNAEEQDWAARSGWTGEMKPYGGDYILWADANLGALKTDAAVVKELSYKIYPAAKGEGEYPAGEFIGEATMKYRHQGEFDWRTSRYRTYARLFVPAGSRLLGASGAMVTDKSEEEGAVEQGEEGGRQWFGAFKSIEPGRTGELSFKFYLSPSVAAKIANGEYGLLAQKQLGSLSNALTLRLDFGKPVISASPPESPAKQGDGVYDLETDLQEDRKFEVKF